MRIARPQRSSPALLSAFLLASCAAPGPTLPDTVGPISGVELSQSARPLEGYLEVRTRTESVSDGGILYERHTPYTVYTPEGRLVRGIQNHTGPTDQQPRVVRLPEGRYVVYAWSEGAGRVGVRAVVVRNQLTRIDLQYQGMALPGDVPPAEAVRLPDGRIIGRRARVAEEGGAPP